MSTNFTPDFGSDSLTYKQEPPVTIGMVEEPVTNQNTSRSRSSDGERTQYKVRIA